jgi:site-specific recombinase XerD
MTLQNLAITIDNTQLLLPILGEQQAHETPVNSGPDVQSIAQPGQLLVQSIAETSQLPSEVQAYISASLSDNTRRAYQQDLEDFHRWGGTVPSTPEILAAYIADQAHSLSPYTITRRVVGISRAHVSQGFPDPAKTDLVRAVLRGIRKKHGKPQRQVAPLLKQDLLAILPLMQGTKGIRDRALILLGFAAALRRSELVALDTQDLQFVKEGLVIHLRRSKTDQHGQGRNIAVPYGRTSACPIKAVQIWLEHSCISTGSIFRSVNKGGLVQPERLTTQSVALILKGYAQAAGLNPKEISGHSLRSGLVTSAAQIGVAAHKIQQQTGHRSMEMLHRYIRDANLFENNPAGLLL